MAIKSKSHIDGAQWASALMTLIESAPIYEHEVNRLNMQFTDPYSLMAWRSICRHLRAVADGMAVMRLYQQGKSTAQIAEATGIQSLSIRSYKAWRTVYLNRCRPAEVNELMKNVIARWKVIGKGA